MPFPKKEPEGYDDPRQLELFRWAHCTDCSKSVVPSDPNLPFFRKGGKWDSYYCGCRGWD